MSTQTLKIYRFFTVYEQAYKTVPYDDPRTGERRHRAEKLPGQMREVHMVEYGPLGSDKTILTEKVERLRAVQDMSEAQRNPAILMAAARWSQIEPLYNNWKKGIEPTAEGTPLAAWNGVGREQAEVLKQRGIATVQQLAALNDHHFERFGIPGLRTLTDNARRYLTTLDNTVLADKLAEKDAEIANLSDTVEEMKRMLAEVLTAKGGGVDMAKAFDPPDDFVDPTEGAAQTTEGAAQPAEAAPPTTKSKARKAA